MIQKEAREEVAVLVADAVDPVPDRVVVEEVVVVAAEEVVADNYNRLKCLINGKKRTYKRINYTYSCINSWYYS
jgi:hypothetical protein